MLIHAKPGAGKTTLAIQIARLLTGDPAINEFLDSGLCNLHRFWQRSRVLFIQSDMTTNGNDVVALYLQQQGWAGAEFLKYIDWMATVLDPATGRRTAPWTATLEGFAKLIKMFEAAAAEGTPYRALIVDSLKMICPADMLVGSQEFRLVISLLSDICCKYNCVLIYVHHSANDGTHQGIKRIAEGVGTELHMDLDRESGLVKIDVLKVRGARGRTLHADLKRGVNSMPLLMAAPSEEIRTKTEIREEVLLEILENHVKAFKQSHPELKGMELEMKYTGITMQEIMSSDLWQENGINDPNQRTVRRALDALRNSEEIFTIGKNKSAKHYFTDFRDFFLEDSTQTSF
jgi:hypothetical protein